MGQFSSFGERLARIKKKKELKQAFRRKPKPSKVKIQDDIVPVITKDLKKGN